MRPPKKMIASGEEKVTKSAQASPRIAPVDSNISRARASPTLAASKTSLEVVVSISSSRSLLSSERMVRSDDHVPKLASEAIVPVD